MLPVVIHSDSTSDNTLLQLINFKGFLSQLFDLQFFPQKFPPRTKIFSISVSIKRDMGTDLAAAKWSGGPTLNESRPPPPRHAAAERFEFDSLLHHAAESKISP
jgi:hypothetical protein